LNEKCVYFCAKPKTLNNKINKQEIDELLKNIQSVLRNYSISDLNQCVNEFLSKSNNKSRLDKKRVHIVLETICKEFNLSIDKLLIGRGKGDIQEARKYAYIILNQEFNLTIRYIAKYVFALKWHTSVAMAIKYYKNLNNNIKIDRDFSEKFNVIMQKINVKIKNEKI
jgi:chromosomal replication initiation ATPase DnaA